MHAQGDYDKLFVHVVIDSLLSSVQSVRFLAYLMTSNACTYLQYLPTSLHGRNLGIMGDRQPEWIFRKRRNVIVCVCVLGKCGMLCVPW